MAVDVGVFCVSLLFLALVAGGFNPLLEGEDKVESQLRSNLTRRRGLLLRPAVNLSHPVSVQVEFFSKEVLYLDPKKEIFSMTALFVLKWTNEKLQWDPQDFDQLDYIFLPEFVTWTPLLYLTNKAATPTLLDGYNKIFRNILVTHRGILEHRMRVTTVARCAVDLRKFPFDRHTCSVHLDSGYGPLQSLSAVDTASTFDQITSGWRVRQIGLRWTPQRVTYSFLFERSSTFFALTFALPLFVCSVVTLFVLLLSSASAEKTMLATLATGIQFALLSHAMFVAPRNGSSVPLILILLVVCLIFTSVSLISSAVIFALSNTRDATPPRSLPKFVSRLLCVPVTLINDVSVKFSVRDERETVTMETSSSSSSSEQRFLTSFHRNAIFCIVFDRILFLLFIFLYIFLLFLLFT